MTARKSTTEAVVRTVEPRLEHGDADAWRLGIAPAETEEEAPRRAEDDTPDEVTEPETE